MTAGQQRLGVGKAGRRVEGRHERQLRRTLAAWSRQAHLVGDENAAIRDALKAAARNVDRADTDENTTPYARAMILRYYSDLLTQHAPPAVEADTDSADPWSLAVRDLVADAQ